MHAVHLDDFVWGVFMEAAGCLTDSSGIYLNFEFRLQVNYKWMKIIHNENGIDNKVLRALIPYDDE